MPCQDLGGFHFAPVLWEYDLIGWVAPIGLALMLRGFGRWSWPKAIGLALMTVPLWFTATGFVASIPRLLCTGGVLSAYTPRQLSAMTARKLLEDLGYLVAGGLLYVSDRRANPILGIDVRTLAARLRAAGLPMPVRERHSAFLGLVAFPVLWYATVLATFLVSQAPALNQNDETNVFRNMTVYHAVLLSAAAAFGEELLYRGVLQTVLERSARKLGLGARTAAGLALGLQAVVFGLAHAGYGTYSHVIGPFLFGLAVGYAARRHGLWMAIVMHFLIDFVIFMSDVAALGHDRLVAGLSILLLANLALTIAWASWQVWKRMRLARPAPT